MAVRQQQFSTHSAPPRAASLRNRLLQPRERNGLAFWVYVLLAAVMLLEISPDITLPDELSRNLPFFEDFATWTHIKGLSFSMAELMMAVVLLITLLVTLSDRTFRFDKGSLMRPLGLYIAMVAVGYVHGRTSGGDSTLALWEIRNQVYLFIAYILTCNLIRTRRQVHTMMWIVLVGTGLKAAQCVWRYRITYHGSLAGIEAVMPHEQSLFFNAFLTLTAILFMYSGTRRMKHVALIFLPFVIVGDLANQRRAAILAIVVATLALLAITAIMHRPRRKVVIAIVLALAVVGPAYYIAFQHSHGLTGEIAHALSSVTSPDPRDANSNLYRQNEDKDIMATMRSSTTSALIGYGYGKPMLVPYALADISQIYVFWNIMPHDSILWIWMRTGTIGYILFWLMIGIAIIQVAQVMRRLEDLYLKGLALWILLMIVQLIIFAYLDLQWANYRSMLLAGMLFALISRLAALADREGVADVAPRGLHARPGRRPRRPDLSPSLAVVDGRLVRTPPRIDRQSAKRL